jgi:hypothetical protein
MLSSGRSHVLTGSSPVRRKLREAALYAELPRCGRLYLHIWNLLLSYSHLISKSVVPSLSHLDHMYIWGVILAPPRFCMAPLDTLRTQWQTRVTWTTLTLCRSIVAHQPRGCNEDRHVQRRQQNNKGTVTFHSWHFNGERFKNMGIGHVAKTSWCYSQSLLELDFFAWLTSCLVPPPTPTSLVTQPKQCKVQCRQLQYTEQ